MLLFKFIRGAILLRIANVMACSEKQISSKSIKYLNQTEAITLDEQLFNDYKYSVDQLMELAGLSVATAVARVFPSSTHERALIICGPGNNGGDGLVAARHMSMFGYKVAIHYPIRKPNQLYERLLEQATRFNVDLVERLSPPKDLQNDYELLVDALFGFSFKPPVRPTLQPALDALITSGLPVCSVDIPSGWHVENGPEMQHSLKPTLLISLSAPKMCAKPEFLKSARHFLGGRFLPPSIIKSFNLSLPPYPNQDQVVEICDTH